MADLTERQIHCLRLTADGLTIDEIAAKLYVSQRTAKNELQRARHILGARSTVQAVAIAYRTGQLDPGFDRDQLELVRLAQRMGRRIVLVPRGERV